MSVPTLALFVDGQQVTQLVGAKPKAALRAALERVFRERGTQASSCTPLTSRRRRELCRTAGCACYAPAVVGLEV